MLPQCMVSCLESAERAAPESDKYAFPFTLPFLSYTDCHPDHNSERLCVLSAHIYVPSFGGFHSQSACDLGFLVCGYAT